MQIQVEKLAQYNNINKHIVLSDLDVQFTSKQWKEFHYFFDDHDTTWRLQHVCKLFCKYGVQDIVSDYLMEVFVNNTEYKAEVTFLLNNIFSESSTEKHLIKNVLTTYLEPEHWNLSITVTDDLTLPEIRKNILQICLQTEGIGLLASALQKDFELFLLKSLYLILERAGLFQCACFLLCLLFALRFKSSLNPTSRFKYS